MKKQAFTGAATALFVLALTVGMATTGAAETDDDNETSDVNVTVATSTALDVKPDQLTYENVQVGERVNETDNSHGFQTLKVENTGSEDIQRVWLETTYPNTNPFGTGDEADHDSGNFLQVKPTDASVTGVEGNESVYHYIQRVEYFEEDNPLVDLGDFADEYDTVEVGRVRFGNDEFYVALGHSDTTCETGELRVANTATTPDNLGTTDFDSSNDGEWTNYSISGAGSTSETYGITESEVTFDRETVDETQTYDIMSQCDSHGDGPQEDHMILTRYNVEAGTADNLEDDSGDAVQEIFDTSGSGDDLYPGQHFGIDAAVQVPRGVPAGELTEGTLTVYSQAAP